MRQALAPPRVSRPHRPRPVLYDEAVLVPLRKVWAVLDAPAGKRLAPFLPEIVPVLRACGELEISDEVAGKLVAMSAATIDRRLAGERARLRVKGRSGTKPGSLLKAQIPIRTWADWDDDRPGFIEIDLVGHDGGEAYGQFCQTLTGTDIATGWTETTAVRTKAQKWVLTGVQEMVLAFPFPILGLDSDNGSEFINAQLLDYCTQQQITFTRSRPGHSNDGAHVEQKNWSIVRQAVGYHRYDTDTDVELLNQLYALLRLLTNFYSPQQKLIAKTRHGAKITKRYDTARTPYQRLCADPRIPATTKTSLTAQYQTLNPAQLRRDLLTRTDQILHRARTRGRPRRPTRAQLDEATKHAKRAS